MLVLRQANINDCLQYFDWANDKVVRKNAFNQETIDWKTHKKWFKNKLNDKNNFLYVAENNKDMIGQVSFDCKNNKATISYSIAKKFRRLGCGKPLIKQAIKNISQDCLNIKIIEAKVKVNNIASNKIFLGLNFNEQNRTEQIITHQLALLPVKAAG